MKSGLTRVHNVAIEDVAVQGTTSTGIEVPLSTLSPNIVTGAPLQNSRAAGRASGHERVHGDGFCLVEDCVAANIGGNGIQMLTANSGNVTSSGIIRGCVISRCGVHGIDLIPTSPRPGACWWKSALSINAELMA